jgi:hypothetical protein
VVICDRGLLGKKFKEGKFQLEVRESFYGGEETSEERCIEALRNATIANMVGSIVERAIEAGLVDRANVLKIQGVKHAQLVRF